MASSRSKSKRWKYVLGGLLTVAVLLHVPPTKRLLARVVSAIASRAIGGPFELGTLDYSLWRGKFEFNDVTAVPDASVFPITFVARRVELQLSWAGRVTLGFDRPEITLFPSPVRTDEARPVVPRQLLPLGLARLEAQEGALRVLDADHEPWLEIDSFELEIARRGSHHEGRLASPDGRVVLDDRHIAMGPLEASIELDGPELRIVRFRLEKGDSRVEATGAIASFEPLSGALDLDFRSEASLLAEWRPEVDVRGTVEGTARLELGRHGPMGEVEFRASDFVWRRLGPWAATGRVSFRNDELELHQTTLEGYRGTVEASGRMDRIGENQSLRISLANLDLPTVGADLLERDLPVGSRASGELSLSLRDWAPESAEGEGRLLLVPESQQPPKLPLGGAIRFSVHGGTAQLESDKVSMPGGQVNFSVRLGRNGDVSGRYGLRMDDVGATRNLVELPIDLGGEIALEGQVEGPLSALLWKGSVTSRKLRLQGQPFEVRGELSLRGRRGTVKGLSLRDISPGRTGTLAIEGDVPLGAEAGPWDLRGELEALDVELFSSRVEAPVQGLTAGTFTITGPFRDPDWATRLSFIGQFRELEGEASAGVRKSVRDVFLEDFRARWSDATVEASGRYAIDAREVEASIQARRLRLAQLPFLSDWPGEVGGVLATLDVELAGPVLTPRGQLRATVEDASFRELALPDLAITAESDGQSAKLEARWADRRSLMSAQAELRSPYPFEAAFSLAALPIDDVLQSEVFAVPPGTRLQADGQLLVTGSALDLAGIEYKARIEQFVGSYRGIGGGAGWPFRVDGDLRSLRIEDLNLIGNGTAVAVSGRIPLATDETFDLGLRGDARLELLEPVFEGSELEGQASADIRIQGALDELQLSGEANIEAARGTFEGIAVSDVAADFRGDGDRISLRSFSAELLGGAIRAEGELPLPSKKNSEPARLSFEASKLDLAEFIPPAEEGSARPRFELGISGFFEASELSVSSIRGRGTVPYVRAALGRWEISNTEPAPWSLEGGRLALSSLRLKQGQTDLRTGLTADFNGDEIDWEGSLQGSFDNALLNLLIGTGDILVSGKSELDLKVKRAAEGPLLAGNGSIDGGRVLLREPPLIFSNVGGQLHFEERRVTLSGLRADAGGGTVEGSGTIDVSREGIGPVDLALSASGVRLDYPPGLRSQQSGSFRVTGGPERFLLAGDLRLLQSFFSRNLTLESELLGSASREGFRLVEEEPFTERVQLELRAQTVEDLQIENNLGKLQAGGNVTVSGTLASPELDGLITARPEGKFRLGRNEYTVESGRITLRNYPSEAPELDVRIRTEVSGIDIAMRAEGPADNLKTQLSSEDRPDLSRGDLASLLLTGRTLENTDFERISGQEREVVTEQLVSFLGGTLGGLAERGLGKVLPVESVTVDPARIASEVDPQTRLTLGMGFTKDLFVTYSVGLDDSQSRLWIVDYSLPKNLGLRGSQQEDEYTGGISHKFSLDFHRSDKDLPPSVSTRRVGSVQVVGSLPGLEEESLKAVRTKSGDRFDYWKAQDDARRLRELTREQGYLGAVVDVERSVRDEEAVDLVFRVEPGKRIELVWRGDDPGSKARKHIEEEWEGRIPETFLVSELASEILGALRRKGYLEAQIETEILDTPEGWRRVIFDVSRGERSKELIIDFDGNEVVSDQELQAALPKKSSPELYELLFENPSRLRRALEAFYSSKGYLDAHIGQPIGEPAAERYRFVIPVYEGVPSNVASIEFRGAESMDTNALRAALSLRSNEPLRLSDYRRDRTTLTSHYRREGFVDARVKGGLERSENGIAVIFEIDEGARAVVGDISIVGNRSTRESIIRRQLTFAEGEPLRFSDLADSERRLQDLGIFRSTTIRVDPAENGLTERNVVVEVAEIADLAFGYGLRYNSEEHFQVLTELRLPNLLGGGQHAGLIVRASADESLVRGTFHTPYLFSRFALGTDLFFSREVEDTDVATTTASSITFQQTKALRKWLALKWSYRFRRVHFLGKFEPIPGFPPLEFFTDQGLVSTSLIEDRRDSVVRPRSGRFWNVTFQGAPAALGSDIPFVKFFGQFILFVPLGEEVVWASSYRLGIADAFGEPLPRADRFNAGGFDSVRGFAQDSLGAVDPITETTFGGEGLAVFNQELRLPLYRWIRWATFFDAGNVYENASDFDVTDLRYSGGVGLRVDLPFGLLRLDWARAFNRRPEDDASQIWFSFGHAF